VIPIKNVNEEVNEVTVIHKVAVLMTPGHLTCHLLCLYCADI